ncbi:MAG: SDR family oxidoreductase [Lentisphaeria bacterium]|nr:SDR family oxidoreductase [Lentisphaeria bacterium]
MKRILVTGGAGFIGSNLTDALLASGYEVRVIDNFSTGKRENIDHLTGNPLFTLIEGDIRNIDDCRRAVENVDAVFHEAALGSVPRSIKTPELSTAVNIGGFVNMLTAAKDAGVKRFIYASSSSVYGDCTDSPKTEDRTGTPLSPYALTKSVNEQFAGNFSRIYGMECIGLRYFNVFGRRQDPEGAYAAVIPKFAAALLNHSAPVINGDGSYSRDFTYIDDVIQANILALNAALPAALNTVYNVACGNETTLNELFDYLKAELTVFDPEISGIDAIHGEVRAGDIPHSKADISRISALLGYKPEYTVKTGLQKTAKWYFDSLRKK